MGDPKDRAAEPHHFTAVCRRNGAPARGERERLCALAAVEGTQVYEPSPEMAVCGPPDAFARPAPGAPFLALAGQLDDPAELARALGSDSSSPAELAAGTLGRSGGEGLERLRGAFALLWSHSGERTLHLARDPLGNQALYYHLAEESVVVSTDLRRLFQVAEIAPAPDWCSLAQHFALQPLLPGSTFFTDVNEVPAREILSLGPDGGVHRRTRTTILDAADDPWSYTAVELRRHLERSIERSTVGAGDNTPVAVLTSGGLDSSTVLTLAARQATRRNGPPPVAISWVFPELDPTERSSIERIVRQTGADWAPLEADSEWPLKDLESLEVGVEAPTQDPFQRLMERSFRVAVERGCRVLVTGHFADELFLGANRWLRSIARTRRFDLVLPLLAAETRLRSRAPATTLKAALHRLRGREPNARFSRPWLTDEAAHTVRLSSSRRGSRYVDPAVGQALPMHQARAIAMGLEVRYPFRDTDLARWILTAPEAVLCRPGARKWLLAESMRGVLPDSIRLREHAGTLLPLVRRGLWERERATVSGILGQPGAQWPRLVRREWLERTFFADLERSEDGNSLALGWMCLSLERWLAALPRLSDPASLAAERYEPVRGIA